MSVLHGPNTHAHTHDAEKRTEEDVRVTRHLKTIDFVKCHRGPLRFAGVAERPEQGQRQGQEGGEGGGLREALASPGDGPPETHLLRVTPPASRPGASQREGGHGGLRMSGLRALI